MGKTAAAAAIAGVILAVPPVLATGDGAPQAGPQRPAGALAARAEALDGADVTNILNDAFAAIGCVLPTDLVSVFDIFLVDRAMAYLGEPVGPEVAQQGFFALRHRSTVIDHPEAAAVLGVARALEGRLSAEIRSDRLTMRGGLFRVADCEARGDLFALAAYASG